MNSAFATPHPRHRRGFSLLEVMVALAILTVSIVLLVETQSSAVLLTREAERMVTATDLTVLTMTEAMLTLEQEGFQVADVYESGDFDDLGDDLLDMEFGKELQDYHWEYAISEVDIDMIGDIASMTNDMEGGLGGDGAAAEAGLGGDGGGSSGAADMLGALGFGPEQITEMLAPYIREVRVRVWWGEGSDQAEEDGTEVVITTHVINPTGVLSLEQEIPQ